MKKRLFDLANLALLALTGVFAYRWYPHLPARIPMHFNMAGQPDRWGGRGGFISLFAMPFVLTAVFYLLIRFLPGLGTNPRAMNIPHKEEFLKLPAEKRDIYWAVVKEFLAGLAAAINLLFYLIVRGATRIATGETSLLPFKLMLPALAAMALIMAFYFRRLITLPGKLVRGEE
ncbi:MAG: DUF1648 domain-containing protein [Candidatus Aminicenantales bacterium]